MLHGGSAGAGTVEGGSMTIKAVARYRMGARTIVVVKRMVLGAKLPTISHENPLTGVVAGYGGPGRGWA